MTVLSSAALVVAGCGSAAQFSGTNGPPPVPTLSMSPASLAFGNVVVGSTQSASLSLTNPAASTGAISVTQVNVTGSGFSLQPAPLPITLSPGQGVQLTISAAPVVAGSMSGSIVVISSAANSSASVPLSATAVPAPPQTWSISGTLAPASAGAGAIITLGGVTSASTTADANGNYAFGNLLNGSYTLTPTKSGVTFSPATATVTINNGSVTTENFSAAPQTWNISGKLSPSTSAAGANVTLSGAANATGVADATGNYTFAGLANGSYTVTPAKSGLTFTPASQSVTLTNASASAVNFSVAQGQLTSTPSTLSFGSIAVGASSSLPWTLKNSGLATAVVSQIAVNGSVFNLSGVTLPLTLTPGQSATFSAQFTPAFGGPSAGSLVVTSNAANASLTVAMSGTGTAQLNVSPALLSFGTINVGSSQSLSATLSAQGGDVTVSSASLTGSDYSLNGLTLPLTILSGQSQTFTVSFAPSTSGSIPGNVSFVSNSTVSPTSESLSGAGAGPAHSVDLSWSASASTVAGYNVYRGAQSGGPYTLLNTSLVGATVFTDTTVQAGATYFYVVTAVDGNSVESVASSEATAVIPTP